MNRLYIVFICLAALSSCEKVWEDDLQEKALDAIRGRYEIASAVWEGSEPIDIDGDENILLIFLKNINDMLENLYYLTILE